MPNALSHLEGQYAVVLQHFFTKLRALFLRHDIAVLDGAISDEFIDAYGHPRRITRLQAQRAQLIARLMRLEQDEGK